MRPSLRDQFAAKGFESPAEPELNAEGHVKRRIVRTIAKSPDFYGADFVELECGHRGYAMGTAVAGCPRCSSGDPE